MWAKVQPRVPQLVSPLYHSKLDVYRALYNSHNIQETPIRNHLRKMVLLVKPIVLATLIQGSALAWATPLPDTMTLRDLVAEGQGCR